METMWGEARWRFYSFVFIFFLMGRKSAIVVKLNRIEKKWNVIETNSMSIHQLCFAVATK